VPTTSQILNLTPSSCINKLDIWILTEMTSSLAYVNKRSGLRFRQCFKIIAHFKNQSRYASGFYDVKGTWWAILKSTKPLPIIFKFVDEIRSISANNDKFSVFMTICVNYANELQIYQRAAVCTVYEEHSIHARCTCTVDMVIMPQSPEDGWILLVGSCTVYKQTSHLLLINTISIIYLKCLDICQFCTSTHSRRPSVRPLPIGSYCTSIVSIIKNVFVRLVEILRLQRHLVTLWSDCATEISTY